MEVTLIGKSILDFNEKKDNDNQVYELTFENTDKWSMGFIVSFHTMHKDVFCYEVGNSYILKTVLEHLEIIKE